MQEPSSGHRRRSLNWHRKHLDGSREGLASQTRSLRSTTPLPAPLSLPKLHSTSNSSDDIATASPLEVDSVPTETATFHESLEAYGDDQLVHTVSSRRLYQAEPDKDLTVDSNPKIAMEMAIVGDPSYVQVRNFGRSKSRQIEVCVFPSHAHVQHDKDPMFSDAAKNWITTMEKKSGKKIGAMKKHESFVDTMPARELFNTVVVQNQMSFGIS